MTQASFALLLVMSRVLDRQLRSLAAAAIREEAGEVARVAPSYAERHTAMKAYMVSRAGGAACPARTVGSTD